MTRLTHIFAVLLAFSLIEAEVSAQTIEAAGPRALGMGGAFVSVADDSSATWWNPAGLAAGAFLDLAVGRATRASWFTAGTPPFGAGYYRIRVVRDPTEDSLAGRQDRAVGIPATHTASQLGATFVQTIADGVHAGMTVKFVRGGPEGEDATSTGDLDVGMLAVAGAFRLGAVARNLRAPLLGELRLDRQVRIGAAFDAERAGLAPVTVAIDADLRTYRTASGPRRVVAIGAERWLSDRRLGLRAGARINTAGSVVGAATAGASVAIRAGLYADGHVVVGGSADERGWGLAGRVSF